MPDPVKVSGSPEEFLAAAHRLADRFRAMPQSRLLAPVEGSVSRAAAGLALARELARLARAPRELPDAGPFAVGDQIALTAHDLVADAPEELPAAAAALGAVLAATA